MKRFLIIAILFIAAIPSFAQRIVLEKNDSGKQAVALQNFRRITFNGNTVNIAQNDGTIIGTEMSDIAKIYFDDYTRIGEVDFNEGKDLISYISSDEIAVNCKAGEEIAIYNVSGSMVQQKIQESDGGSISIANLPKGIYLLRANRQTVKLIKK
ncbi:MAG: T9SS type A sorting domain-containing protein [Bacteroidaceae bacterium]|nr:T9SS type A sorting domain-containing protein [Bacteroidaceae bacterium]